ncbi:MAG: Gfo/Idh/MocA family oxidoreductase [Clostridia bacterium]|nr:Gfo/Idh/MocA family oxidoreductase [Clostridia bacterium]
MIKVGLVGIGFMGRGHLDQYLRLENEGFDVKLVALCDVDTQKFTSFSSQGGNMGALGQGAYDFTKYALYEKMDEMLAKEHLDYVDIALPTHLHAEYACKAMRAGASVLCEKPMALTPDECQSMIDTANETGKRLMIAQCLRFWPAYEILKEYVVNQTFGKITCAYFARHGGTPVWSYEGWLLDETRSGGCLLDQHVHDVDMVNWLLGKPLAVSTLGVNRHPGGGFDAVSTQYRYEGMVINTQDDWTMNGADMPFQMLFRVNFERGALLFEGANVTVYPNGSKGFEVVRADTGYYREIKYYINHLKSGETMSVATPESTKQTIEIATAERESARQGGAWVEL